MKIGYLIGDKIDGIYSFLGSIAKFVIVASIVVGTVSVPCAAIKYLFFG